MKEKSVIVFLEIQEPNKSANITYITIHRIGVFDETDEALADSGVACFKSNKNFPTGTKFTFKGVQRFDSHETYLKFFRHQLSDYLNSLEEQ